MRKTMGIAPIAVLALLLGAGWTYAQQAGAAAPAAAPPPPPELLFRMTLENDTRSPLSQDTVTTPNVDLQLYGDGKDILVAVGKGPNAPHTFNGLCDRPCGLTTGTIISISGEGRTLNSQLWFPVFIACGP